MRLRIWRFNIALTLIEKRNNELAFLVVVSVGKVAEKSAKKQKKATNQKALNHPT
jgi:hypothetical protein